MPGVNGNTDNFRIHGGDDFNCGSHHELLEESEQSWCFSLNRCLKGMVQEVLRMKSPSFTPYEGASDNILCGSFSARKCLILNRDRDPPQFLSTLKDSHIQSS